jgi:NAD(P)-dependent dehydrogenase (short-subunit alcohol dehydrogenase family)
VDITLNGRKAIVSGSTSGIGFAIAKGLAEAGTCVVLNGRTEKRLKVDRTIPPSTRNAAPVMAEAWSEARNTTRHRTEAARMPE